MKHHHLNASLNKQALDMHTFQQLDHLSNSVVKGLFDIPEALHINAYNVPTTKEVGYQASNTALSSTTHLDNPQHCVEWRADASTLLPYHSHDHPHVLVKRTSMSESRPDRMHALEDFREPCNSTVPNSQGRHKPMTHSDTFVPRNDNGSILSTSPEPPRSFVLHQQDAHKYWASYSWPLRPCVGDHHERDQTSPKKVGSNALGLFHPGTALDLRFESDSQPRTSSRSPHSGIGATSYCGHPSPRGSASDTSQTTTPSSPGSSQYSHQQNNKYKTEICHSWDETGRCSYGQKCQYAHGEEERREIKRHPLYKTEMCKSFVQTGRCSYGTRCTYLHSEDERIERRKSRATGKSTLLHRVGRPAASPLENEEMRIRIKELHRNILANAQNSVISNGTSSPVSPIWSSPSPTLTSSPNRDSPYTLPFPLYDDESPSASERSNRAVRRLRTSEENKDRPAPLSRFFS